MRPGGSNRSVLEVSKEALSHRRIDGRRAVHVPHQGQLPADLRERPYRSGVSRGVWYHSATPEVLERIIQEHLVGGQPVADFVLATDSLSAAK